MIERDDTTRAGGQEPDTTGQEPTGQPRTGQPQVDDVLRSLRSLSDLPVHEHVAVFEAAHVALRHTLSDSGSAAAPSRG